MAQTTALVLSIASIGLVCMAQAPRTPNVEAQREAMKKLGFLVGKWSGEASVLRGPGQTIVLSQTEEARFKLGGLILEIEGIGRTKPEGTLVLQALGLISFDDQSGAYRIRAFNDGRWLETEVKLGDDGHSLSWGFGFGEMKTHSVLRINEKGEWAENAELLIPAKPPQKLMDITVRPVTDR